MGTVKGMSLTQPWASLVSAGAKSIETRFWSTHYRGWLAIHAAKGYPGWARELAREQPFARHLRGAELPTGVVVALAMLVDVGPTGRDELGAPVAPFLPAEGSEEYAFGDYTPGRHMWRLGTVYALEEPIPAKGALGLWRVPDPVLEVLRDAWRSRRLRPVGDVAIREAPR